MGFLSKIKDMFRPKGHDHDVYDDGHLDGCDLDFTENPTPDEESDLFVLFAEALDPAADKTVEEAEREWQEVLGES